MFKLSIIFFCQAVLQLLSCGCVALLYNNNSIQQCLTAKLIADTLLLAQDVPTERKYNL